MATARALAIPEIVQNVLECLCSVYDLYQCARVNRTWNTLALELLYQGSLNDMQFRSPDVQALNCLYTASLERFAQCLSYTKHLLLAPRIAFSSLQYILLRRRICTDFLLPMRYPELIKRLFPINKSGLQSLVLPYGTRWDGHFDLLDVFLTPTVQYLAIDDSYCRFLQRTVKARYQGPSKEGLDDSRFFSLRALTIYRTGTEEDTSHICEVIDRCDLRFFHFEDACKRENAEKDHYPKLLRSLARQPNLQALALLTPELSSTFQEVTDRRNPWPMLKGLYLGGPNDIRDVWRGQLPRFGELEILRLPNVDPLINLIGRDPTLKDRLRMLRIDVVDFNEFEVLLDTLHGFHNLQGLSFYGSFSMDDDDLCASFLQRFPKLQSLECLSIEWPIISNELLFHKLGAQCPKLKALIMDMAIVRLSPMPLEVIPVFRHLKFMRFSRFEFGDPHIMTQPNNFPQLTAAWRRAFPALQYEMAFNPEPSVMMEKTKEEQERAMRNYEAIEALFAHFRYKDSSPWCYALWNLYAARLETEVVGWPIMPLDAFQEHDKYATLGRSGIRPDTRGYEAPWSDLIDYDD